MGTCLGKHLKTAVTNTFSVAVPAEEGGEGVDMLRMPRHEKAGKPQEPWRGLLYITNLSRDLSTTRSGRPPTAPRMSLSALDGGIAGVVESRAVLNAWKHTAGFGCRLGKLHGEFPNLRNQSPIPTPDLQRSECAPQVGFRSREQSHVVDITDVAKRLHRLVNRQ